jgi:hypothetical protein
MGNAATSATLGSLSDSQTVFFRAVGQNNNYTRIISGTINPNFYSTEVSIVWGTSPTLAGATTTSIGTYTGNTPQAFSVGRASVANTTYYYKIIATNIFTTVESEIQSYSSAPGIGRGATQSQTTAATQPTPSIVWEASETTRIANWRLYLTSAANNSYVLERSADRISWTYDSDLFVYGSQHWTNYLNPPTVDYATTYRYYRVKATDNYGRVKYSNVRGVAPINLKWGAIRNGVQVPGAYDDSVPSGSFLFDTPREEHPSLVTISSFLGGFTRYRVTSVRWVLTPSRAIYATSANRKFRAYFRTGWTGDWTGLFDDNSGVANPYTSYTDYPDNSLPRSNDGYWTTETLNYGGGDMSGQTLSGSQWIYSDGRSNLWSASNATTVEVFVFLESQGLRTTTSNSETLYYNGAT